jgi:alpha-beta hydrolase superfamily lysophospholipase
VLLEPDHEWHAGVEVQGLSPKRIVFERSEESERPGVYGLVWQGGHAVIGPVVRMDEDSVTRRLRSVDGYLVPGVDADLDTDVFNGDPRATLGLPFEEVDIRGELGPMPAWIVPPAATVRPPVWAIVVHGMNGTRREGLRIVPTLRRAGLTSMLISYRNDLGDPESPDGLHNLGQTEWRDLEAAVRYARAHGAAKIVLAGYSLGGSIVSQFMQRSKLAPGVSALVLDAPVLDWRSVLENNASRLGFPAVAARPLEWAVDARIDVDWDSLDAVEHPEDFHLPILLFHGLDDDVVSIGDSDEFAAELRPWITYYRVSRAGHTQEWNVNPALYDGRLARFLSANRLAARANTEKLPPKRNRARPDGSGSKE